MNENVFSDFKRMIANLEEVLALEKNAVIRDSAIKRFEICFDLAWKSIKEYSKGQGLECNSPRICFKTAYQLGLIEYEEKWLNMIEDRNLTAHLYKEENADQVYLRLKDYSMLFKGLLQKLES